MRRTPMEMSCWRGMQRRSKLRLWTVFRDDWLYGKRGRGSGVSKAYKELRAELAEYVALERRIARHGSTVYE